MIVDPLSDNLVSIWTRLNIGRYLIEDFEYFGAHYSFADINALF